MQLKNLVEMQTQQNSSIENKEGRRNKSVLAAEQPHFAPKTYWWNRLLQSDVFVIMDNDYFNRKHWQNKTEILLAGKRHRFTVPIQHGEALKINEVNPIDSWGTRFRKTIHYAYANSKFYSKFKNEVFDLAEASYKNLADLDMAFIKWAINNEKNGSNKKIVLGSSLKTESMKTQYYIDLCEKLDCNAILVGQPTLTSYLDLDALKKAQNRNQNPQLGPSLIQPIRSHAIRT